MKSWLVLFVVVCVVAIVVTHEPPPKPPPLWVETPHATQIHVGPWVADIPDQWRDIHELREPNPGIGVPIPGSRTLLFDGRDYGQIDVFPISSVFKGDNCQALADMITGQNSSADVSVGDVQAATFGGDPGCMMRMKFPYTYGQLLTRTRGIHGVAVRCLGAATRVDGGYPCDKIIFGLRIGE